jgi:hypothetical protein
LDLEVSDVERRSTLLPRAILMRVVAHAPPDVRRCRSTTLVDATIGI